MTYQTELFDSMIGDINSLSGRPDLADETQLALRTATNNAHFCDAFPRDLVTTSVQLPNASYLTQLDLPTQFPKLRGLSQLRPLGADYQPVNLPLDQQIKIIELGDIYDDYGAVKTNIAYLAGDKINIRSLHNSYGFIVDWYKAPLVRREEYNSWIAQLYPDVIVYWAASIVLDISGNEEKATKLMKQVQSVCLPYLKSNFLLGELR